MDTTFVMKKLVVGLGEVLWDVFPDGKKLGGAPANFAFYAGQFGNEAVTISAIGTDDLGTETLDTLEKCHLKCVIPRVPFETGTVQVTLNAQGVPAYEITEGVAWDNIPFTSEMETIAHRCDAVCWGSLAQRSQTSRSSILRFIDSTRENCLRIFDINLRGSFYTKEVIEESLRRCNIFKINDEEFATIITMFDYGCYQSVEGCCQALVKDYNLKQFILTCGAAGSFVFSADGTFSKLPAPKVEVADTVGAGDSFTGTFCSALLAGLPVKDAHQLAGEVSAYVCTQNGAMAQLPQYLLASL